MTALANFSAWFFSSTFIWSYILMAIVSMMAIRQTDAMHLRFSQGRTTPEALNLLYTLLWGAAVGAAGSALWLATGFGITERQGMILWMVSFGFMLLGLPDFSCLLSGAVVSLIELISGGDFSDGIRILLFMALCQSLFGVLVLADGRRDSATVVVSDPGLGAVGGRMLSRIWIMPVLGVMTSASDPLAMLPLALPVGIGMIAHRESPRTLVIRKGVFMVASGILTFSVGFVMMNAPVWTPIIYGVIAALCIAGWLLDRRSAGRKREPWCGLPKRGVRVLDVHHGSVGEKLGLRPGDIILRINGSVVMQEPKIEDTLERVPPMIWVDFERAGRLMTGEYADYQHGVDDLGIVTLTRNMDLYLESVQPSGLWFSRRH